MSKSIYAAFLVCFLAGCGGGGGGSAPAVPAAQPPVVPVVPAPPVVPEVPVVPVPVEPAVPPPLSVVLTASTPSLQVVEGGSGTLSFVATVSGASSRPVIPVIAFDDPRLALLGEIDASIAGKYTITLATLPDPAGGTKQSHFSFQLCEDAACARPHANTLQTVPVALTVTMFDWGTMQRDNAHRAYVPLALDPAAFRQIWSWMPPKSAQFNPVATGGGKVFVTSDDNYRNVMYALDEQSAAVRWNYTADGFRPQAPAYADGMLYTRAVETADSFSSGSILALNAATGAIDRRMRLTDSDYGLAPVVDGGTIYASTANFSSGVSAFAAADGTVRWQIPTSHSSFATPAVDLARVYSYDGATLLVHRRSDGAQLAAVPDPLAPAWSNSNEVHSTPMLGSNGNVLVLRGTQFTGTCCTSGAGGSGREIVNIAVTAPGGSIVWKTAGTYLTQPAFHDGVIYAGTGAIYIGTGYTARFDAISEATGAVLWSWTPPDPVMSFFHNVVVTKNLAFVSTDQKVYAIDLKTHQAVWSASYAGSLAIGAGGVLVISTGTRNSDGRLVGIQLQ